MPVMEDDFTDIADAAEPEPAPATSRTTAGTRKRKPATRSRPTKRVADLRDALAKQMFTAGTVIGLAMPVTGYYIAAESDPFCDAIIRLASKDSRYLDALESLAAIGPGVVIGRTVVGIGCAMGVDRWAKSEGQRGFSPEKRAAMLLGVSAAYYEVYGSENGDQPASGYAPPPNPVYVPVS